MDRAMRAMTPSSVLLGLPLAACLTACGSGPVPPASSGTTIDVTRSEAGEPQRLDDYPLFYLRTSSDYGFDAYRRGVTGAAVAAPRVEPHRPAWACTCFSTAPSGDGPLFGRNFDWWHRASLLLYASPANALASLSMVDLYYLDFADTVTLDQIREARDRIAQRAPYLPFDGVNEKGVAMGMMAVPSAEPPFDPGKVSLYDLALIRLVLDYAVDTNHALELLAGYNYRVGSTPCHFLIADRSGTTALVEYAGGAMRVTRTAQPFMVATNFVVYGSQAPISTGCPRYDRAYATLSARNGALSRAEALNLLSAVSQDITMWSTVYDLRGPGVEVVPGRRYGNVYRFAMGGGG
jgi:hypothetical protein